MVTAALMVVLHDPEETMGELDADQPSLDARRTRLNDPVGTEPIVIRTDRHRPSKRARSDVLGIRRERNRCGAAGKVGLGLDELEESLETAGRQAFFHRANLDETLHLLRPPRVRPRTVLVVLDAERRIFGDVHHPNR